MTRVDKICSPGNGFKGFLVLENEVQVFSYVGHGAYRRPEHVDSYSMFDAGNPTYRQDFPIDNPAHVIRSYAVGFLQPERFNVVCQWMSETIRNLPNGDEQYSNNVLMNPQHRVFISLIFKFYRLLWTYAFPLTTMNLDEWHQRRLQAFYPHCTPQQVGNNSREASGLLALSLSPTCSNSTVRYN